MLKAETNTLCLLSVPQILKHLNEKSQNTLLLYAQQNDQKQCMLIRAALLFPSKIIQTAQ
jgi:hypothetical protein